MAEPNAAPVPCAGAQIDKYELLGVLVGKIAKWWLPDVRSCRIRRPASSTSLRYQDHLIESAKAEI